MQQSISPQSNHLPPQEPCIRLQISNELTEFPRQVFDHAQSLEILDLSDNKLSDLPDDLDRLLNMRILFLSNNHFESIPQVLARCPKLEMISFKSNRLAQVGEGVFPRNTRWLILTDNKISQLPDSMGQLHRLQKLALAGNDLTELPKSMVECKNLELARLSANELQEMPNWLFQLPKLTWLAFSGNAFNRSSNYDGIKHSATVVDVALDDIVLAELIGEGASGHIYRARWKNQPKSLAGSSQDIAVKIFKGEVTSDGYPQDELGCCLTAGSHEKLIKVVAQLDQLDADKKLGLVMELISQDFFNLGLPPSLKTCTRDTFQQGSQFSFDQIIKIGLGVCDTLEHLHANGISHGDVYAHNTMINDQADVLLGDFGAATNLGSLPALQREAMEAIEVRALGCLLDDVLGQVNENTVRGSQQGINMLIEIVAECMQPELELRPKFLELTHRLKQLV